VLLQAFRWIEDSRDEMTKQRLAELDDSFKLYRLKSHCNYKENDIFNRVPVV
jgi:succinate dehydrogenase/fumarate reductase-like Fe-S protein